MIGLLRVMWRGRNLCKKDRVVRQQFLVPAGPFSVDICISPFLVRGSKDMLRGEE
jgi:hypothetical protein